MENSVGIIGAGWLGEVLALTLMSRGFPVQATTRSLERMAYLKGLNISVEQAEFPLEEPKNSLYDLKVFEQKTLVICIPPQLKQRKLDYPLKVKQMVDCAEKKGVEKVILLSSTAIYNGLSGDVNEASVLQFKANKVAILAEAENVVLGFSKKSVVLRLAGLVGPKRHPARFFSKQKQLLAPSDCVNLIHQIDAVELIVGIIQSNLCKGIYNGVSNTQMSKAAFYELAAQSLNLPFAAHLSQGMEKNTALTGKRVNGEKLRAILNYQYCFDDLVQWMSIEKP